MQRRRKPQAAQQHKASEHLCEIASELTLSNFHFLHTKFDAAPKNVEKQKRGTDGLRHFSEVRWWWLLPGRYITSRR